MSFEFKGLTLTSYSKGTRSLYFSINSKNNTYSVIHNILSGMFYCDCMYETNKLPTMIRNVEYKRCKHIRYSLEVIERIKEDIK